MDTLYTLYKMPITHADYEKVSNFCTDMGFFNIPSRENMAINLAMVPEIVEKMKDVSDTTVYLIDELEVVVTEALTGDGTVLAVIGKSPVIAEMIQTLTDDFAKNEIENLVEEVDESEIPVVISFDLEGDVDLDYITQRFNEYVDGELKFGGAMTEYHTEEEMLYIMDGAEYFD